MRIFCHVAAEQRKSLTSRHVDGFGDVIRAIVCEDEAGVTSALEGGAPWPTLDIMVAFVPPGFGKYIDIDIDIMDAIGATLFALAAETGNGAIVRALLKHDTNFAWYRPSSDDVIPYIDPTPVVCGAPLIMVRNVDELTNAKLQLEIAKGYIP